MGQRAGQTERGHQRHAEQNIGQIADRRIGQTALEVSLLERAAASIEDGEQHDRHDDGLRPGTAQEIGAEAVIGQADDGECARLDDRHCDRRGRDARLRQPCVEWTERGLDAEAEEGDHIDKQQGVRVRLHRPRG